MKLWKMLGGDRVYSKRRLRRLPMDYIKWLGPSKDGTNSTLGTPLNVLNGWKINYYIYRRRTKLMGKKSRLLRQTYENRGLDNRAFFIRNLENYD